MIKDANVLIRVDSKTKSNFFKVAEKSNQVPSVIIRRLMRQYVQQQQQAKQPSKAA